MSGNAELANDPQPVVYCMACGLLHGLGAHWVSPVAHCISVNYFTLARMTPSSPDLPEASPNLSSETAAKTAVDTADCPTSDRISAQQVSMLRFFGFGLCMGTADAVPGVSGGTIALILGYYDQFIDAIAQVLGLVKSPFKVAAWRAAIPSFKLLLPLVFGAICSLFIATKVLVGVSLQVKDLDLKTGESLQAYLTTHPPQGLLLNPTTAPLIFAVFFGLVLFSIRQPWQCIRQRKACDYVYALAAAAVVAAISLLNPTNIGMHPLFIILSGMLAISVMLLPGISGSLVLLIIGMYQPISEALHNREFAILAYFALGIILGAASFVPLLKYILHHFHDRTMATLSGLMVGSLVALWPWKTHYLPKFIHELGPMLPVPPESLSQVGLALLCVFLGGALIYGLQKLARVDKISSQ